MSADEFLAFLQQRQSIRRFKPDPIAREVLERLVAAAMTAPSASNRQPWRFHVITDPEVQAQMVQHLRGRVGEMEAIIAQGHHREDYGRYSDFFHEPLQNASAIIIPSYRRFSDLIAQLVRSGGGDPARYNTSEAMQSELCATSAACMALLLQAQAEGLGACWMAGPMVARDLIEALLGIKAPYQMVGAISLGWPDERPSPKPRKPTEQIVTWV